MKVEFKYVILNVARELFSKYGFQKTTMDEVAAAVRKGKSSLYYYFKGKDELFQAVIEYESNILKHELRESVSKVEGPKDKLKTYFSERIRHFKELPNFLEALKSNDIDHLPFIDKIREDFARDEHKIICQILDSSTAENGFRVENSEKAAEMILLAMNGVEFSPFIRLNGHDTESLVEELLNALLFGLGKKIK